MGWIFGSSDPDDARAMNARGKLELVYWNFQLLERIGLVGWEKK
jgi:hypothetical protein